MSNDTRQPAGVPTGGQFATTTHPEADVAVFEMTPGQRAVSLAMDGGDLGQEIGAVVTYKVEVGIQTVCFEKRGAGVTVLISGDPKDTHPYQVMFHTEDDWAYAGSHSTLLCTPAEVLDRVRTKLAPWS